MDGIQNSTLPKYIEYKGRTFLNISDQITKHEGNIDELTQRRPLTVDPEKCRRRILYKVSSGKTGFQGINGRE